MAVSASLFPVQDTNKRPSSTPKAPINRTHDKRITTQCSLAYGTYTRPVPPTGDALIAPHRAHLCSTPLLLLIENLLLHNQVTSLLCMVIPEKSAMSGFPTSHLAWWAAIDTHSSSGIRPQRRYSSPQSPISWYRSRDLPRMASILV